LKKKQKSAIVSLYGKVAERFKVLLSKSNVGETSPRVRIPPFPPIISKLNNMEKIIKPRLRDFIEFVREHGVFGLALGIIIGGAVTKLVTALVTDLINPIIGIFLGKLGNLTNVTIQVFSAKILIGNFISALIDFLVIVAVVYFGIKKLGLEKLDKKKETN
jgi:large conductance mechanosensitive channel